MRGYGLAGIASAITLGMFTATLACGGAAPMAHSAIPNSGRDPAPLAKCSVAPSHAEPLVTEWPASEKARLEAMVASGAVLVSYTGCELHIVSECSLGKGKYEFQRTTLANDTVDISNADELYAKLPLGAARLEGDLQRSGGLAVQTTVIGLHKLAGAGIADVPSTGECDKATHLVTQLAVGAFKLLARGKAKATGGAGVGNVGAAGSHAEEEVTLTEAGDPKACAETGDQLSQKCRSPIQIFLQPLPGRTPPQGPTRQAMEEDKPPPDSVRVNFKVPNDGEHWSLLTSDGKLVCDLPCSRWVAPKSGFKVQLDADKQEDIKSIAVPADLGYSPGRTVEATPRLKNGRSGLGWLLVPVGGVLTLGGVYAAIASPIGIGVAVIGVAGLGGGIWMFATNRSSDAIDVRLVSDSARVRVGPGFVEGSTGGASPVHVVASPAGIAGSF
jgi:hypothetical protein